MRTEHNTAVPNNWQAEFGMAPATEDSKVQNAAQVIFLSCFG
jgi:hypothetical protein